MQKYLSKTACLSFKQGHKFLHQASLAGLSERQACWSKQRVTASKTRHVDVLY
jgi:hypothetical protein